MMANVLIIDDDLLLGKMLTNRVHKMGHRADWKSTLKAGLDASLKETYDVVLLDVQMPDGNGLDILPQIRMAPSAPEVIIMTGKGDETGAEDAIHKGAWDYIPKSGSSSTIVLPLQHILQYRKERDALNQTGTDLDLNGIIGNSTAIRESIDQLAKAAGTSANVLISGETGTGKEVFARAVHHNSSRSQGNMVVVDCAALPETLVESLLFGHVKGVYTGADRDRQGLVGQAHKGTLFLDEVGEMPLSTQKVFLRVLQEKRYRPVGGHNEISSDFRLIAATNQDLDKMVKAGRFRKDLLYRIRAMNLILPPLRERQSDIKPLTQHFLANICERLGIADKNISSDFIDCLRHYPWPGNVRELINTLESVLSSAGSEQTLFKRHLPTAIRVKCAQLTVNRIAKPSKVISAAGVDDHAMELLSLKQVRKRAVAKAEEEYLQNLLSSTHSNISNALRVSRLSRSRFYELIKQYDLSVPCRA